LQLFVSLRSGFSPSPFRGQIQGYR
jgi:hypothetical protein